MRTQTEGFDEPKNEWQPISQVVLSLPNLKECLENFFWENDYNISVEEMDFEGKKTPIIAIDWHNGGVLFETSFSNTEIYWEYKGRNDDVYDDDPQICYPPYKNQNSYKSWNEAIVLFFDDVEDNASPAYNIARRIMVRLRDAFSFALAQAVQTKLISVYGRRRNMDEPYTLIEPSKWGGVTIDDWMTGDAHLKGGVDLFGLMAVRGPNWPQENAVLANVEVHSNDIVLLQKDSSVRREEKSISSVWLRPDGKEPDFGKKRDQRTIYELMRRIEGWEQGIPWSCRSDRLLRHRILCNAHGPHAPNIVTMDRAIKFLLGQGVQIWAD